MKHNNKIRRSYFYENLQIRKFFRLMVVYNKHRTNKMEFVALFDSFLEEITSVSKPTIIYGDMNIDLSSDNQLVRSYKSALLANDFECCLYRPTRVTRSTATCIDHFIYLNIKPIIEFLEHQNFTDHYPDIFTCKTTLEMNEKEVFFRNTKFLNNPNIVLKFHEIFTFTTK